jgi:hypothetical protein
VNHSTPREEGRRSAHDSEQGSGIREAAVTISVTIQAAEMKKPLHLQGFYSSGAEAGTRTPMALRPLAPEASASANSATSAVEREIQAGRNIKF